MSEPLFPLISVVIAGRNDNYLGDFRYRLTTCINFLARSAGCVNRLDDLEVVVTDWNSPAPLHGALKLTRAAARITRFVAVPPEVAGEYSPEGVVFRSEMAFNVALRRAGGQYVLLIPADILIPVFALNNIFMLLEKKLYADFQPERAMMNISRKLIPWQIVEKKYTLAQWDRYIQLCSRHLKFHNHFVGLCAGYGAILMHRKLWFDSQACKEDKSGWGADDIDIGLRINQKYPSIDLVGLGVFFYDMYHSAAFRKQVITRIKLPEISETFDAGNPNWGLGDRTLKEYGVPAGADPVEKTRTNPHFEALQRPVPFSRIEKDLRGMIFRKVSRVTLVRSKYEWALLHLLIWWIKSFWPARYLEYGRVNGEWLFPFACHFFPALEVYTIGRKMPGDTLLTFKPTTYHTLLKDNGFSGYAHFSYEAPDSGLKALERIFIGPMGYDLILFRTDLFDNELPVRLKEALVHLEKGGAMIVTGPDRQKFRSVWAGIVQEFSAAVTVSWDAFCFGIVINTGTDGHSLPDIVKRLTGGQWHPPPKNMILFDCLSWIMKRMNHKDR